MKGHSLPAMVFLTVALLLCGGPREAFAEQASPEPAYRRGLLALPFLGAHVALGGSSRAFDLGFRVGGVVGYRAFPFLSINGEIAADFFNGNVTQSGETPAARAIDVGFSPLFHLALDRGVLVIGPRLGAFRYTSSLESWEGTIPMETVYGLVYGLNLGVFGGVGHVAVGALVGYSRRHATDVTCEDGGPGTRTHGQCLLGGDDLAVLSATVAALF